MEGKTDSVVRMSKEAGKSITQVDPWSGLPEHVTGLFPVTGPDEVTRLEAREEEPS